MPEELVNCPTCQGKGKVSRSTARKIFEKDLQHAVKLLQEYGAHRECVNPTCRAHLEQSEVTPLSRWHGSKVKQVREALRIRGTIQVTYEASGGRPSATWHLLSDGF